MTLNKKAVVVLSGGQDSMTVLNYALARHNEVACISFDYGQRHSVELTCAAEAAARHNCTHTIVDVHALKTLVASALTSDSSVSGNHERLTNLPASFVPARNAIFLTLAHAYAAEIGADTVYGGMCQTDYNGFPDCREVFMDALCSALNLGYQADIKFVMPVMHLNKAETFAMAEELGCLDEIIEHSHTCYVGNHDTKHEWGYGCGECPSCKIRAAGWAVYNRENVTA